MNRETSSDDISKSSGYCHHGNTPNSCEYCLKEQNKGQAIISEKSDSENNKTNLFEKNRPEETFYDKKIEEVRQNISERLPDELKESLGVAPRDKTETNIDKEDNEINTSTPELTKIEKIMREQYEWYPPDRLDFLTGLLFQKLDKNNTLRDGVVKLNLSELINEVNGGKLNISEKGMDEYLDKVRKNRQSMVSGVDGYLRKEFTLPKKLRNHQDEALLASKEFLEKGGMRGYITHPTGAGKTILFSSLIKLTSARTLVIVPKKTLVIQTLEKLADYMEPGTMSQLSSVHKEALLKKNKDGEIAALAEHGSHKQVVIATEAAFKNGSKNLRDQNFDLIIWDEAHNGFTGNAQKALRYFPDAVKIGFTATPDYLYTKPKEGTEEVKIDNQTLYRDPEKSAARYYPHEIHNIEMREAIMMGMLAPVHAARVEVDVDLSKLNQTNTSHGDDFRENELIKTLDQNWSTLERAAIEAYTKGNESNGMNICRQQLFAITASVKQAERLAKAFNKNGVKSECITGKTSDEKREELFAKYRRKEIQLLTSVAVLKEGWDAPEAEVCLMLRPTTSRTFYQQAIGRVLRLDENNPEKRALIVDFLGKYSKHAPLTTPSFFGIQGDFYNGDTVIPPEKRGKPGIDVAGGDEESEAPERSPFGRGIKLTPIEQVERAERAPEGWMTNKDLAQIAKRNPEDIKRIIDVFFKEKKVILKKTSDLNHEEMYGPIENTYDRFKSYLNSSGKIQEYYSPYVINKVLELIAPPKDGWTGSWRLPELIRQELKIMKPDIHIFTDDAIQIIDELKKDHTFSPKNEGIEHRLQIHKILKGWKGLRHEYEYKLTEIISPETIQEFKKKIKEMLQPPPPSWKSHNSLYELIKKDIPHMERLSYKNGYFHAVNMATEAIEKQHPEWVNYCYNPSLKALTHYYHPSSLDAIKNEVFKSPPKDWTLMSEILKSFNENLQKDDHAPIPNLDQSFDHLKENHAEWFGVFSKDGEYDLYCAPKAVTAIKNLLTIAKEKNDIRDEKDFETLYKVTSLASQATNEGILDTLKSIKLERFIPGLEDQLLIIEKKYPQFKKTVRECERLREELKSLLFKRA